MGLAYSPLPSCHSGTSDWPWTPDAQRPRFFSLERKYRPKHSYRCYSLGGALGRLQAPSVPTVLGPTACEPDGGPDRRGLAHPLDAKMKQPQVLAKDALWLGPFLW